MQIENTKKHNSSALEYFNKVKALTDTLSVVSYTLRENEIISYLLTGLDRDYDSLVTSVTTRSNPMTLSEVYTHLLSFEMWLDCRNDPLRLDGGTSANFTTCNTVTSLVVAVRCSGQQRSWARQGATSGGNEGNNNVDNRLVCYVCSKVGYVALKYFHRFDHSYQVVEGSLHSPTTTLMQLA